MNQIGLQSERSLCLVRVKKVRPLQMCHTFRQRIVKMLMILHCGVETNSNSKNMVIRVKLAQTQLSNRKKVILQTRTYKLHVPPSYSRHVPINTSLIDPSQP